MEIERKRRTLPLSLSLKMSILHRIHEIRVQNEDHKVSKKRPQKNGHKQDLSA